MGGASHVGRWHSGLVPPAYSWDTLLPFASSGLGFGALLTSF